MAQSDAVQDITVTGADAHGQDQTFKHPAVQSAMMFLGEFLCLVPFFIHYWHSTASSGGYTDSCMNACKELHPAMPHGVATMPWLLCSFTTVPPCRNHCHWLLCWQACTASCNHGYLRF